MSNFVCAISGEVAEQPVVSPVSGEVFEKRNWLSFYHLPFLGLILKYLNENGTDPTNGQALAEEQVSSWLKVINRLKNR